MKDIDTTDIKHNSNTTVKVQRIINYNNRQHLHLVFNTEFQTNKYIKIKLKTKFPMNIINTINVYILDFVS